MNPKTVTYVVQSKVPIQLYWVDVRYFKTKKEAKYWASLYNDYIRIIKRTEEVM